MPFAYDWSLVGIDLAIALLTVSALVSAYRIVVGPLDADRAVSGDLLTFCLLYTSPSPRDVEESRMPSSA